ncbi:hypothetical protein EXN69_30080 [Rhizobium rhizogenes]|nr:hypothetical protein EXN69_30080 [Rhizobium rhizogenes]
MMLQSRDAWGSILSGNTCTPEPSSNGSPWHLGSHSRDKVIRTGCHKIPLSGPSRNSVGGILLCAKNATDRSGDRRARLCAIRFRLLERCAGLTPVEVVATSHRDQATKQRIENTYRGTPISLGYLSEEFFTNEIIVSRARPPFDTSFTNGILSTQFLARAMKKDTESLEHHMRETGDSLREFLAGDTLPVIRDFFSRPTGRFFAALYELEDVELVDLLKHNAQRLNLILSDAGGAVDDKSAQPNDKGKYPQKYDTRNSEARNALRALANQAGSTFTMRDRMFNGSGHIGHNKFVVHVDDAGKAMSVLTGSTNWTWTGITGQSNNCIVINNTDVANSFLEYWTRLDTDPLVNPVPLDAYAKGANQSDTLKKDNRKPGIFDLGSGVTVETWFSPNMPKKSAPPPADAKTVSPPPPDMDHLFSLMRQAKKAVMFLVFMPSVGGVNSVISQAVEIGKNDTSLNVIGAISDSKAMWGYEKAKPLPSGEKGKASSPHIFQQGGVSVIRATALTDRAIEREIGDFLNDETLSLGTAIIHDKLLVIDPLDPVNCVVAFGSHNFGFKASYSNDENLVIVKGHQDLAVAYAVHVLDVYDHYRFRAKEAEKSSSGKGKPGDRWKGFLDTSDEWQSKSSHRLARYFTP